jgi:hypothetical protein
MVIEMRRNVRLCRARCTSCHLFCVLGRLHEGDHSCETTHKCVHNCVFCKDRQRPCGTPCVVMFSSTFSCRFNRQQRWTSWGTCVREPGSLTAFVFSSTYSCVVNAHLCGGPCKLSGKRGCLQDCTKVSRCLLFRLSRVLLYPRWRDTSKMNTCARR